MYATTQHVFPAQTIFGAGYVPDQHSEQRNLPPDDAGFTEFVKSLGALIWGDAHPTKQ
jgi:hypothetical protein